MPLGFVVDVFLLGHPVHLDDAAFALERQVAVEGFVAALEYQQRADGRRNLGGGILDIVAALPQDVTVLLIEHDMDLVFQFAKRISVLVNGGLFVEGTPEAIARDLRVKEVYLGEAANA